MAQFDPLAARLRLEHLYNVYDGRVWIELDQVGLEHLVLDQFVIQEVVDEVEQKLGLELDLHEVLLGLLLLLWGPAEHQQEVDNDNDGTEGSSHLMRHVFIAESESLDFCLIFLDFPLQREVGHFLGDVSNEHDRHVLL